MPDLLHFAVFRGFPGLVHGISDRRFGSVHPPEDGGRQRLAEALGIAPDAFVSTRQVHMANVERVRARRDRPGQGPYGADGLITDVPGLYLLGYFGDCVPILAHDPIRRAVGLVHAGWRGTLLGITSRLVEHMREAFSTRPGDLYVGLGPSIGPCCYEVGAEVVEAVRKALPGGEELLRPGRPGHAFLDLWEANRALLLEAGVPAGQIEVAGVCTSCHVARYFSYRRDGRLDGLFGAAIGLRAG